MCGELKEVKDLEGTNMPFKSKAQARKLAMMTAKGEFPKSKFEEFARSTKNFKKLPERKKK